MSTRLWMYAGNDRTFTHTVTLSSTGAPVDLTGAKVWFTIKNQVTDLDSAAVIQLTSGGGGITVASPSSGVATATIAGTATTGILGASETQRTMFYDWQVRDAAGNIATTETGTITLIEPVTRART